MERNKKWISEKKTKHLSEKRNTDGMTLEVEAFIEAVELSRGLYSMSGPTILNYDETRVCVSTEGEVLIRDRSSTGAWDRPRVLGSLLSFVSGERSVLVSFWIMKADCNGTDFSKVKLGVDTARYPRRSTWDRYNGTETGYINNDIFRKCMEIFTLEWHQHHPGLRVFVFGDQLANHVQLEVTRTAYQKSVEMWLIFRPTRLTSSSLFIM